MSNEQSDFERRAREVFDTSVEALDAETRSRLNRARQMALEQGVAPRTRTWRSWAPAGAIAAAIAAAVLWRMPGDDAAPQLQVNGGAPLDLVELVAEGDDLDLVTEDLEFYGWVAEQAVEPSNGVG